MDMRDEKKKSIAAVIVAKMKPKMGEKMDQESEGEGEESEADESTGKMEAARELMEAVASRDAQGVKDAMQSFYDMCQSED